MAAAGAGAQHEQQQQLLHLTSSDLQLSSFRVQLADQKRREALLQVRDPSQSLSCAAHRPLPAAHRPPPTAPSHLTASR